jgi:hypothetical protein
VKTSAVTLKKTISLLLSVAQELKKECFSQMLSLMSVSNSTGKVLANAFSA